MEGGDWSGDRGGDRSVKMEGWGMVKGKIGRGERKWK